MIRTPPGWKDLVWFDRVRWVLDHLEYMPGYEIRLETCVPTHPGDPEWVWVITWWNVDSRDDNRYDGAEHRSLAARIPVGFTLAYTPAPGIMQILRQIRVAIGQVHLHERDEWLRFKGEIVFDPHIGDGSPATIGSRPPDPDTRRL